MVELWNWYIFSRVSGQWHFQLLLIMEMQQNKQIEREDKLIQLCMRKQIAMAEGNPVKKGLIHTYSRLPHALADKDGLPVKGKKSSTITFLTTQY